MDWNITKLADGYQNEKSEILLSVQYKEDSTLEGNVIRKTYATKENGVFYEVNDGGRIEFWSDKHPESRIYDENERAAAPAAETDAAEAATPERVPGYGELLQEKIRTETKDFNALNDFEKFILNRGYLYDTEEELKAGYDRAWKASHGIMVTAEEFAAEIKSRVKWDKELDVSPLYEVLSQLVKEKKLKPGDVFQYAVYTWCLRNPKNSGEEGRDIYKGKDYLRGGRSAGLLFSVGKLIGGDYYKGLHREKRPGSGMYPCGWLQTGKKPVYAGRLCRDKNPCHAGGHNDGRGKGTGNCACSGEIEIGVYFMPPQKRPPYWHCGCRRK
mgnify:FL=1